MENDIDISNKGNLFNVHLIYEQHEVASKVYINPFGVLLLRSWQVVVHTSMNVKNYLHSWIVDDHFQGTLACFLKHLF